MKRDIAQTSLRPHPGLPDAGASAGSSQDNGFEAAVILENHLRPECLPIRRLAGIPRLHRPGAHRHVECEAVSAGLLGMDGLRRGRATNRGSRFCRRTVRDRGGSCASRGGATVCIGTLDLEEGDAGLKLFGLCGDVLPRWRTSLRKHRSSAASPCRAAGSPR